MHWTPVKHGNAIVALQSGDYVIVKEVMFGDVHYFAQHQGGLLSVTCDADRARAVCERHANGITEHHENGDGL